MNFVFLFPMFSVSDRCLLRPYGVMNALLATAGAQGVSAVSALGLLHARPHRVDDGAG